MKTTLVIHPQDHTTDFLQDIYDTGMECDVLHDFNMTEDHVSALIPHYDRIIILGHGSPDGLFGSRGGMVVNSSHADVLRDKELICIWCNADQFMKENDLKGFHSGMFISEVIEAHCYDIYDTDNFKIYRSNALFAKLLGTFIDDKKRLKKIKESYRIKGDKVVKFNRNRLYDTK